MYLQRINYTFFCTGTPNQEDMLIDALGLGNKGTVLSLLLLLYLLQLSPQQCLPLSLQPLSLQNIYF